MTIDPNAVINSPAPALFLALVFLSLVIVGFVSGSVAPGSLVKDLLGANKGLREELGGIRAALEKRNDLDEERLRVEREYADDRRTRSRSRGG